MPILVAGGGAAVLNRSTGVSLRGNSPLTSPPCPSKPLQTRVLLAEQDSGDLVVNGKFTYGIKNWVQTDGTVTWNEADRRIRVASTGANGTGGQYGIATLSGTLYRLRGTIYPEPATGRGSIEISGDEYHFLDYTTYGSAIDLTFVSNGTGANVNLYSFEGGVGWPSAGGYAEFDDVSIQEVPIGVLVGSSDLTFSTVGIVTGTGALVGASILTFSTAGILKGSGALAGTLSLTFTMAGAATGQGALTGASTLTFALSGTALGAGALNGATSLTFSPVGVLTGAGALAGSSAVAFTCSGGLGADGVLAGSLTVAFTAQGSLEAAVLAGAISGSASFAFTLSGSLVAFQWFVRDTRPSLIPVANIADPAETIATAEVDPALIAATKVVGPAAVTIARQPKPPPTDLN